jgi:hypothetical protein
MKRKAAVFLGVLLTLTMCCKESKKPEKVAKKRTRPAIAMAKTISASPYTGGEWVNGIHQKGKNQFFLAVAKNMPTPVRIGDRLKFAAAGAALVQNVYRFEKDDQSLLFVHVDKELDPTKDGYPFPIHWLGRTIKPGNYSDGQKWKNGIQLTNKRIFFFILAQGDIFPLRSGDVLRFRQSGQVTVKRISRSEKDDGSIQFIVQVDRDLDPDADGYPHTVELIFRD